MANYPFTVRTRCLVYQVPYLETAAPLGNLSLDLEAHLPLNFTRWPGGAIYVSDGLNYIYKWDGISGAFERVGLDAPTSALSFASSGSGSLTGTYVTYVRFLDKDGVPSGLSPASTETAITSDAQIDYTAVPTPTDIRVVRKQILRNTNGQLTTFYVDVDTTDIAGTAFTSTLSDDDLSLNDSVDIVDDEGNSLLGFWDPPRSDKPLLAPFHGRMFAFGEVTYTKGHCEVTVGSTTVQGRGTAWLSTMIDRNFIVVGHQKRYTITAVSESAQTLTLDFAWAGDTNKFAVYQIRPPLGQRNLLYYSEANQPDLWPDTNSQDVGETGDVGTALIPTDGSLYLCYTASMQSFNFGTDPALDSDFSLFLHRGCLNQRTWCKLGEAVYLMDRLGVYRITSGGMEDLSPAIGDIFSQQVPGDFKIDWTESRWFHAVADPQNQLVRFAVSVTGPTLPFHALSYHVPSQSWFLDEYAYPVTASVLLDDQVKNRVLLGGPGQLLLEVSKGKLDGPNDTGMVLRGTASTGGLMYVTVPYLTVPSSGLVGHPIAIVDGTGKGQLRVVDSVSSGTFVVTQPWATVPDSTSIVQVGAIRYQWRSGWHENVGLNSPFELVWTPTTQATHLGVRFYLDYSTTPLTWPVNFDGGLVKYTAQDNEGVIDTTQGSYVRIIINQTRDFLATQGRFTQIEIAGFAGAEGLRVHQLSLGAVE